MKLHVLRSLPLSLTFFFERLFDREKHAMQSVSSNSLGRSTTFKFSSLAGSFAYVNLSGCSSLFLCLGLFLSFSFSFARPKTPSRLCSPFVKMVQSMWEREREREISARANRAQTHSTRRQHTWTHTLVCLCSARLVGLSCLAAARYSASRPFDSFAHIPLSNIYILVPLSSSSSLSSSSFIVVFMRVVFCF